MHILGRNLFSYFLQSLFILSIIPHPLAGLQVTKAMTIEASQGGIEHRDIRTQSKLIGWSRTCFGLGMTSILLFPIYLKLMTSIDSLLDSFIDCFCLQEIPKPTGKHPNSY